MVWNILIVDDSSLTRKMIKHIINMLKLEIGQIFEAENGQEALDILEKSNIDLVLSDLNMPGMGGAEMIHRMRNSEATKSIPVVIVSTESKTVRFKELLTEGVKNYLHKPFTPEEFKEMMQSLCTKPETDTEHLLNLALTQVLETMAFLTVMPIDEDMIIPKKTVMAEISFTGLNNGTIQIVAGLDFCKILAENISALDNPDNHDACDALKELSNVICGLFLPMVVSSTADVFDITVPKTSSCDNSSQWDKFVTDKKSCVSNIEGHAVAMKLIIKDTEVIIKSN